MEASSLDSEWHSAQPTVWKTSWPYCTRSIISSAEAEMRVQRPRMNERMAKDCRVLRKREAKFLVKTLAWSCFLSLLLRRIDPKVQRMERGARFPWGEVFGSEVFQAGCADSSDNFRFVSVNVFLMKKY